MWQGMSHALIFPCPLQGATSPLTICWRRKVNCSDHKGKYAKSSHFTPRKSDFAFAVSLKVTTSSLVFFVVGPQHNVGRFLKKCRQVSAITKGIWQRGGCEVEHQLKKQLFPRHEEARSKLIAQHTLNYWPVTGSTSTLSAHDSHHTDRHTFLLDNDPASWLPLRKLPMIDRLLLAPWKLEMREEKKQKTYVVRIGYIYIY